MPKCASLEVSCADDLSPLGRRHPRADIYVVADDDGEQMVMKIQRYAIPPQQVCQPPEQS